MMGNIFRTLLEISNIDGFDKAKKETLMFGNQYLNIKTIFVYPFYFYIYGYTPLKFIQF